MTTIITITKANATTLVTANGYEVTSSTKGVVGQFDKLCALITNHLTEGEFVIEAGKLKGVFKALKENSKACTTFKFVLACNEWGLELKGDNSWVIVRPQGNITLINGSYVEPTQPEEVKVKPKTFCQLLREEWLPSRESWVIDTLKRKMRATWKARKELTCERQGKFMAEFFRRLDVYSPNTELPLQAFLTTYDLVKEDMTGQKTQVSVPEALKVIQKDHNTEEVNDTYTNHLNNLLNKFPDRSTAKENVPLEETQEELKENVIETNDSEEELSEGQPSADTTILPYQLGDILAVTYDDEHNEYAYYGSDLITVKAVVVEGGFQLGEGEDAEVFETIHELCYKASDGNYEGTPQVRVVTEEEIEDILEKEYNLGMGIE